MLEISFAEEILISATKGSNFLVPYNDAADEYILIMQHNQNWYHLKTEGAIKLPQATFVGLDSLQKKWDFARSLRIKLISTKETQRSKREVGFNSNPNHKLVSTSYELKYWIFQNLGRHNECLNQVFSSTLLVGGSRYKSQTITTRGFGIWNLNSCSRYLDKNKALKMKGYNMININLQRQNLEKNNIPYSLSHIYPKNFWKQNYPTKEMCILQADWKVFEAGLQV